MGPTLERRLRSLLLAGALLAPSGAGAAAQATVVRLAPARVTVGAGQTAAVEVRVEEVQNLYGLDVRLRFDPAVVEVVDQDPAASGVQVRPGDLLSLDLVARNTADNGAGSLRFAMTQVNPSPEVSGSGVAFVVIVRGKRQGATSALDIVEATLATRQGEAIPATLRGGEVRVVGEAEAPPTPTPAPTLPPPTIVLPTAPPTSTPAPTATPRPTRTPEPPTATPSAEATAAPAANRAAPSPTPGAPTEAAAGQATPTVAPAHEGTAAPPASSAQRGPSLLPLAGALITILLAGLLLACVWRRPRKRRGEPPRP